MNEEDHVDPQDPTLRNSPMGSDGEGADALAASPGHASCYWNDHQYSDGATVCDNHQRHKCWNGRWVDIGNC